MESQKNQQILKNLVNLKSLVKIQENWEILETMETHMVFKNVVNLDKIDIGRSWRQCASKSSLNNLVNIENIKRRHNKNFLPVQLAAPVSPCFFSNTVIYSLLR